MGPSPWFGLLAPILVPLRSQLGSPWTRQHRSPQGQLHLILSWTRGGRDTQVGQPAGHVTTDCLTLGPFPLLPEDASSPSLPRHRSSRRKGRSERGGGSQDARESFHRPSQLPTRQLLTVGQSAELWTHPGVPT